MICKILDTNLENTHLSSYITDNFEHLMTLVYPMLGYTNKDYDDNEITFGPPFGEFNLNSIDNNRKTRNDDDYYEDLSEDDNNDCSKSSSTKPYINDATENNNNNDNIEEGGDMFISYQDISKVRANKKYKERKYKSMENLYYRQEDFPMLYRHEILEKSKNNKQIKLFIDWLHKMAPKLSKHDLDTITKFAQLDTINYKLTLNTFMKLCSIINLTLQDYIYINNYFNNNGTKLSYEDEKYIKNMTNSIKIKK